MILRPTTIIMLIDFEGHPVLGDEFINNQRFSTLNALLNPVREKPLFIISNHLPHRHKRVEEVAKMVKIENRHIWKTINPDDSSVESIVEEVKQMDYRIENVIIGGTNISGCVLRTKPYSAISWAKKGYDVQILSNMCADYQITGVNALEQNQNSVAIVWHEVAQAGFFNKVSYIREHECQIT
tara:strand:+ start:666 stop:1214 length:549 start_codon:yes stop_codon:yes gene_type:complete